MNPEIPKELCCQCGGHFAKADMHKLKIESVVADFYICNTCLDKMPRLTTTVEPTLN
jgi:hypothetical protein